jgi:hypothetical protein
LADKFTQYHSGEIFITRPWNIFMPFRALRTHRRLSERDGPFGILRTGPNVTETIISGKIWWLWTVGASKMGLEPKISQYMELAVKAFETENQFGGGPEPLLPWVNTVRVEPPPSLGALCP